MARKSVRENESVDTILTDPDVLECELCHQPLRDPVFQCEKSGHIACSSCRDDYENKCNLCSSPAGYLRCQAIEKVLMSIKGKCLFAEHGCQALLRYDEKENHEMLCDFAPCSCPFPKCLFYGSIVQLSHHFSNEHSGYLSNFKFNEDGDFYLKDSTKVHALQGQQEDLFFVLTNRSMLHGNAITITRIGPASFQNYTYTLSVKHQGRTHKLKSFTTTLRDVVVTPFWENVPDYAPQPSILVPKIFFKGDLGLTISFCIMNPPNDG